MSCGPEDLGVQDTRRGRGVELSKTAGREDRSGMLGCWVSNGVVSSTGMAIRHPR